MRIILKIIYALVILAILVTASGYLYFVRDQKIEVRFIPREFKYCDRVITGNDPEYQEITHWLRSNSYGWTRDWNTQITGLVYSYPAYSIVVFEGGISVSYKTDYGFPRFIKSVNHNLSVACTTKN